MKQNQGWGSLLKYTHNRESDGLIRNEVIVEIEEISPTAGGKLQRRLNLETERVGSLYGTECLTRYIPHLMFLAGEMLCNRVSAIECRGRRDVVQRGIGSEGVRRRVWIRDESLVDCFERHDALKSKMQSREEENTCQATGR